MFFINHVGLVLLESLTLLVLYLYMLDNLVFLRTHWLKSIIFLMSYLILHQILNHFNNLHWTIIYLAFCIIALEILTKINFYTNLAANIFTFLIFGVTDVTVSMPAAYFLDIAFPIAKNNALVYMKAMLLIRPVQILIIRLLAGFVIKPKYYRLHLFNKKNRSVIYSLLTILIMRAFFEFISNQTENKLEILISGFLFIAVVLLSFLDRKERLKLLELENKLNLQKEYCRHMEQIVDAFRKEKHDFKNQISTLVALCSMPGSSQEVREYAMKLTCRQKLNELHFYNTGNKYLDGLLSVKSNMASNKGIHFEVDVEASLENILVDDVDLTSIVGNILDNAFDAVLMNPPEKKKIVSLTIYREDNRCSISISNNGSQIPEADRKHIFDYKFSTKSGREGERGYGLYIVKELISRNKGEISFHSDEFETEFIISFRYREDTDEASLKNNNSLKYDRSIFSR